MRNYRDIQVPGDEWGLERTSLSHSEPVQEAMFRARVSTRLPSFPNGKDISFHCIADDGRIYFCKEDSAVVPVRAIEWVATSLAHHLGIPVAEFMVIEDENGDTFFGSRSPERVISNKFELADHIRRSANDEMGRPRPWMGQFFSKLCAFDLFICNPDRDLQNLILDRDGGLGVLKAIDFASAAFIPFPDRKMLIETDPTVLVGEAQRAQFGSHKQIALEMLDRISSVPVSVLASFVKQMPEDWLPEDQASEFLEVWSSGKIRERVKELKALIENEW